MPVAKSVREWAARVEGMEPDVAAIQAQERDEMELRRAEMQANKVRSCLRSCLRSRLAYCAWMHQQGSGVPSSPDASAARACQL